MAIWALLVLIGALGVGVSMTVVCGLGVSDPLLKTNWKYRTVNVGLAIALIFVAVMFTGLIGGIL